MTNDNKIPTYSLLEKHEDVVEYRIPDPTEETPAWIRIGLFPWELEGIPLPDLLNLPAKDQEHHADAAAKHFEGVGLRIGFNGPTSRHPRPSGVRDWVEASITGAFDVFSQGHGQDGLKYRIENATASELRQMGRSVALYAFAYWWWLEHQTTHEIGKKGTASERPPEPKAVHNDGELVERGGKSIQTPYDLSQMELLSPDEWKTPYERATSEIKSVVDDLSKSVPQFKLAKALRDVEDGVVDSFEKTEAKEKEDALKSALYGVDSIGFRLRNSICREFESVEELCNDIRSGSERLRAIRGIGESKEDAVIDGLVENGEWVADQEDTNLE